MENVGDSEMDLVLSQQFKFLLECRWFLNKLIGETRNLIFVDYSFLLSTARRKLETHTLHLRWQKSHFFDLEVKAREENFSFFFFKKKWEFSLKTNSIPIFKQYFDNLNNC